MNAQQPKTYSFINGKALNADYLELFQSLLNEIDKSSEKNTSAVKQMEICFAASVRYYEKLKRQALNNGFESSVDEIEFFREIKPRFTALIEFSVIATEALWFLEGNVQDPLQFWKGEAAKFERFCERHPSFILYYATGERNLDEDYFLSSTADATSDFQSQIFDGDCLLNSSKDWLVSSYLAHKMYFGFAEENYKTMINQINIHSMDEHQAQNPIITRNPINQEFGYQFSTLLLQYLNSED